MTNTNDNQSEIGRNERIEQTVEGLYRMRLATEHSSLNGKRLDDAMETIIQLRTDLAAANERAEKAEPHLYCCPDEINCGRRWEAPDENDGEDCPFCGLDTLRSENAAMREVVEVAAELVNADIEPYPSAIEGGIWCIDLADWATRLDNALTTLACLTTQEGSDQ